MILSHDIADYPDGIVLAIDKPYRWTSADVIRKLKYAAIRHFGKKNLKVGHAGTLDPLATGVLLVCIGNACKRAQQLQDHDKEYVARIRFGATTPSYDLEKEPDRTFPFAHITADAVHAVLPSFLGEQEQVAPLFSAKSVDGVRAYELARKLYKRSFVADAPQDDRFDAVATEILQRNKICISELELLSFSTASQESLGFARDEKVATDSGQSVPSGTTASSRIHVADTSGMGLPEAQVRIACSKGTYIRAFARDLGEALESGAHLSGLVRTRSGEYSVNEALTVQQALALFSPHQVVENLV